MANSGYWKAKNIPTSTAFSALAVILYFGETYRHVRMIYQEIKPSVKLEPYIHSFWVLKGEEPDKQWERNFPDGCAGLVMNLGDTCLTDNGLVSMEFGKTYAVGAMTSFKDSFINSNTHLVGVCLKPASFSAFYNYVPQHDLTDNTVEFDRPLSFNIDKVLENPCGYLNEFFINRVKSRGNQLQSVIQDIHHAKGRLSIQELSQRNHMTVRQLERHFKKEVGISPKEYSNIVRFQHALSLIKDADDKRSLLDIAFECGYYDHSHLANEVKRNTGLSPSQL